MASFRAAGRMFCSAARAEAAPGSVSRWKRLINSKAGMWCRSLLSDYREACREMVIAAWERPLKTSVYLTLLGGSWICFRTKPDRLSFEAALLERSNQLCLLSPWIRNAASDGHVQSLMKLRNEGRLRCASLGLLCLIYHVDFDKDSVQYEARCSNLSMPWREFPQRVLDFGFTGHWWILDSKMKDYDVNEEEFKFLPAYMQETSPPSAAEVEKNESLHKASWLPLTMKEEEEETNPVNTKSLETGVKLEL